MTQNRFLMFLIGLLCGLFIAFIPTSISVYALHTGYHLSHYLVLVTSALFFGGLAVVQKEKFGDTLERVLNSMFSG